MERQVHSIIYKKANFLVGLYSVFWGGVSDYSVNSVQNYCHISALTWTNCLLWVPIFSRWHIHSDIRTLLLETSFPAESQVLKVPLYADILTAVIRLANRLIAWPRSSHSHQTSVGSPTHLIQWALSDSTVWHGVNVRFRLHHAHIHCRGLSTFSGKSLFHIIAVHLCLMYEQSKYACIL